MAGLQTQKLLSAAEVVKMSYTDKNGKTTIWWRFHETGVVHSTLAKKEKMVASVFAFRRATDGTAETALNQLRVAQTSGKN